MGEVIVPGRKEEQVLGVPLERFWGQGWVVLGVPHAGPPVSLLLAHSDFSLVSVAADVVLGLKQPREQGRGGAGGCERAQSSGMG